MNQITRPLPPPTDSIDGLGHFLQLIGADVWAVCEAEIEQHPLAEQVIAGARPTVVVNQLEPAAESRLTERPPPLLVNRCPTRRETVKLRHCGSTETRSWAGQTDGLTQRKKTGKWLCCLGK